MNYIFKSIVFIHVIVQLVIRQQGEALNVAIVLIFLASNAIRERYTGKLGILLIEIVLVGFAAWHNHLFIFFYIICLYDMVGRGSYWGIIPVFIWSIHILGGENLFVFLLPALISCMLGYARFKEKKSTDEFNRIYDNERRYRYELEQANAKLVISSREAARLAEVQERNRIARDIHDNVGHSITGNLMQLQAAFRLHERDQIKAMELIKKSIDGLSKTVEILRNTVHNIKPRQSLGIEYIEEIIKNFSFCPVDYKVTGNLNGLNARYFEILVSIIKEALTNASRHSKASLMNIDIESKDRYVRLYIKDNGRGCKLMKEGLGISGMRERVRNAGGNLSISSEDGFMIVCFLPVNTIEGGKTFENTDCR